MPTDFSHARRNSPDRHSRRGFLRDATSVAGALAIPFSTADTGTLDAWLDAQRLVRDADTRSDADVARDESYWSRVRRAYDLHPKVINFDHGWTNPTTRGATDLLVRSARELEALPAEMLPEVLGYGYDGRLSVSRNFGQPTVFLDPRRAMVSARLNLGR